MTKRQRKKNKTWYTKMFVEDRVDRCVGRGHVDTSKKDEDIMDKCTGRERTWTMI